MGYVWREIRQQSSEEPCDETSFGKNIFMYQVIKKDINQTNNQQGQRVNG